MENIILQTHGISVKYGKFLALDLDDPRRL